MILLISGCNKEQSSTNELSETSYEDIPDESSVNAQMDTTEAWVNTFAQNHPDIAYFFVPSDSGEFETIGGNYTVVVDNVEMVQDEDETYQYFRLKYDLRSRDRAQFNEGIDTPAEPEGGFNSYLKTLNDELRIEEDVKGTIFVEVVIGADGNISNAQIVDGMYGQNWSDTLESKVLKVIMDNETTWTPAQNDGTPTSSRIEIPLTLNADSTSH
jgi:hypothetical protein